MGDAQLKYIVEIELQRVGDAALGPAGEAAKKLTGETDKAFEASKRLASGYAEVGSNIIGAFNAGMGAMVQFGSVAATAGFGLLTHQALSLDIAAEKTRMSLGALFDVGGAANGLDKGLALADQMVVKLRKDAADLPGEFSDLINIFRTVAMPAMNKGMDVNQIEKLSARAMAAGAALDMNQKVVARELAMMMEGRVGAHNIFAMRLGVQGAEADKFRGLDDAKKVDYIIEKLAKYDSAIAAFGKTWDAQSSTLVDNVKKLGMDATTPVFEKAKGALIDINAWFDKNKDRVTVWATYIGTSLANAFEYGQSWFEKYFPRMQEWAIVAHDKFVELFNELKPFALKVGEFLKDALSDPNNSIDKIIEMLKLYAVVQGVGAASGVAGGLLGPIAKAGWANGMAGAAGAAEGAGVGLSGVAGLQAGAMGAAKALGALGAVVAEVAFFVWLVNGQYRELDKELRDHATDQGNAAQMNVDTAMAWRQANEDNIAEMTPAAQDLALHARVAAPELANFYEGIKDAEKNVSGFDEALWWLKDKFLGGGFGMVGQMEYESPKDEVWREHTKRWSKKEYHEGAAKREEERGMEFFHYSAMLTAAAIVKDPEKKKKAPEGNTTIVINQTITSNQAAGQIARRVVDMITSEMTKGGASSRAPNFSKRART